MEISKTQSSYFDQLEEYERLRRERLQESSTTNSGMGMDMYVPSNVTGDETLTCQNYNDIFSQKLSMLQSENVQNIVPQESVTETEETEETDETENLLKQISSTMRVREDSILSTLDELGLSTSDLYEEENMEKLVNALDAKASDMGLPRIDNVEDSISSLTNTAKEIADSMKEKYGLSEEDLKSMLSQAVEV